MNSDIDLKKTQLSDSNILPLVPSVYILQLNLSNHFSLLLGQYISFPIIFLGGKQWQPTPKKLPRMQCARAIPVAWLGSGSCHNRPSGWILLTDHFPCFITQIQIWRVIWITKNLSVHIFQTLVTSRPLRISILLNTWISDCVCSCLTKTDKCCSHVK